MFSTSDFLDQLVDLLEHSLGALGEWQATIDPSDRMGALEGVIRFPDGCELHVDLVIDQDAEPLLPLASYRFHCQDRQKRCVVRFDNKWHSSHQHQQLATFPHHLHEGPSEQVQPHPYPSARQIVRRVLSYHDGHQGLP